MAATGSRVTSLVDNNVKYYQLYGLKARLDYLIVTMIAITSNKINIFIIPQNVDILEL